MKGALLPVVLFSLGVGACASSGSPALNTAASKNDATSEARAPREPDPQPGPEDAADSEAIARQFLGGRRDGIGKARAYQWLTAGRLYWIELDRLVAVVGAGRTPVALTGDIVALRAFLAMQFNGRLPGVDALPGIAQLVKDAVIGKGGHIATPDFFESQRRDGLDGWLKGRERDPAELKRVCSGIRRTLNKNEWTLEFNVINASGGVDVVRASGTPSPLTLQHVSAGVLKARGEFSYPLKG